MILYNLTKREKFALVFLTLLLVFFVIGYDFVKADSYGLDDTASKGYGGKVGQEGVPYDIPTIIGNIVGAALAFVGVIFFVLIVWGGYTWMMARGNEQEVVKAKELIYGSIIGIVIILAAYAITSYIGKIFVP